MSWTRRELLCSLLGLPLAAAGCTSPSSSSLPDGQIVGIDPDRGHRLRGGRRIVPGADAWQSKSVVIVGGGVAGLSAAWRLKRAGVDDFVILELESTVGGTSRSGQSKLTAYPWGAHYLPAPARENRALLHLLDEMHVIEGRTAEDEPIFAEEVLCRDPQERLFYKGRWYEGLYLFAGASSDDLAQLARFRKQMAVFAALRDGQGRRAFSLPMSLSSDDAETIALDRVSMDEWLDAQGYTSERLRWLVDYSCRDDYGLGLAQTSAWAGIFYFASRALAGSDDERPLLTWPDGNGQLVKHLQSTAREQVQCDLAVAEIVPRGDEGHHEVDVVALDAAGETARGFHAQAVIFAVPQFLRRHIIRDDPTTTALGDFTYGSWLVANVQVSDRPQGLGFSLAWDNVFYDSPSLGYVVATHQRGPEFGPTVLTYYYPFCGVDASAERRRLYEMEWSMCAQLVLADLSRVHPRIRDSVQRIDVMRWGHAMIQPRPGFIWGSSRRSAATSYRGIHFANTDLSGVALFEEAFYHGVRAAETALAGLGRAASSML